LHELRIPLTTPVTIILGDFFTPKIVFHTDIFVFYTIFTPIFTTKSYTKNIKPKKSILKLNLVKPMLYQNQWLVHRWKHLRHHRLKGKKN